jgi:hypothetical protein
MGSIGEEASGNRTGVTFVQHSTVVTNYHPGLLNFLSPVSAADNEGESR